MRIESVSFSGISPTGVSETGDKDRYTDCGVRISTSPFEWRVKAVRRPMTRRPSSGNFKLPIATSVVLRNRMTPLIQIWMRT